MKIHRFFGEFDFEKNVGTEIEITDKELVNQIANVLKLKEKEHIILQQNGMEMETEIVSTKNRMITVSILEKRENKTESEKSITLYCAILKKENFELVAQKATEVGVTKIVPIVTDRTVKTGLRYDRLQKIIQEAAEQSGRGKIPELSEAIDFETIIKNIQNKEDIENGKIFFFDMNGKNFNEVTEKNKKEGFENVSLFIGPEGGWSLKEKELISEMKNTETVSISPFTLRGETAAIIATYLLSQNLS